MARIAIDARMCGYRQGGIASYTRQLAATLAPLLAAQGDTFIIGRARRGRRSCPRNRDWCSRISGRRRTIASSA